MAFGGSVSQLAALSSADEDRAMGLHRQALATLAGQLSDEIRRRDTLAQQAQENAMRQSYFGLAQQQAGERAAEVKARSDLDREYFNWQKTLPDKATAASDAAIAREIYNEEARLADQGLGADNPKLAPEVNATLARTRAGVRASQESAAAGFNTQVARTAPSVAPTKATLPLSDYATERYTSEAGVAPYKDTNFSPELARWSVGDKSTGYPMTARFLALGPVGVALGDRYRSTEDVARERAAVGTFEDARQKAAANYFAGEMEATAKQYPRGQSPIIPITRPSAYASPSYQVAVPAYTAAGTNYFAPSPGATAPVVAPATRSVTNAVPPLAAIQRLRSNPNLAPDFDAKYGVGEANKYLAPSMVLPPSAPMPESRVLPIPPSEYFQR